MATKHPSRENLPIMDSCRACLHFHEVKDGKGLCSAHGFFGVKGLKNPFDIFRRYSDSGICDRQCGIVSFVDIVKARKNFFDVPIL